jgi:hypothetical protein
MFELYTNHTRVSPLKSGTFYESDSDVDGSGCSPQSCDAAGGDSSSSSIDGTVALAITIPVIVILAGAVVFLLVTRKKGAFNDSSMHSL